MRFDQLPRDENGAVTGSWRLRHRSAEYADTMGGITFAHGVTTHPVDGQTAARVLVCMDSIEAEPWAEVALQSAPPSPADAPVAPCSTPTTWAELEAMDEEALRVVAVELKCNDKRFRAPKLRSVIAEELGIDSEDESDGD